MVPLHLLDWIIPDVDLSNWKLNGILWISQLYERDQLKSFQNLQTQYSLPNRDFYKYLQICHLLITPVLFLPTSEFWSSGLPLQPQSTHLLSNLSTVNWETSNPSKRLPPSYHYTIQWSLALKFTSNTFFSVALYEAAAKTSLR